MMTSEEVKKIAATWAIYAAYYRQQFADEILMMYAEDVADLDFETIQEAFRAYKRNPKSRFCPMPADLRQLATPEVDTDSAAREIAARINGAVIKFGHNNGQAAREAIGEVGWQVVQKYGGWGYLCRELGVSIDPVNFAAQCRELAKSDLKFTPDQMNQAIGAGDQQNAVAAFIPQLIKTID